MDIWLLKATGSVPYDAADSFVVIAPTALHAAAKVKGLWGDYDHHQGVATTKIGTVTADVWAAQGHTHVVIRSFNAG